jgi:hypothetical protein
MFRLNKSLLLRVIYSYIILSTITSNLDTIVRGRELRSNAATNASTTTNATNALTTRPSISLDTSYNNRLVKIEGVLLRSVFCILSIPNKGFSNINLATISIVRFLDTLLSL